MSEPEEIQEGPPKKGSKKLLIIGLVLGLLLGGGGGFGAFMMLGGGQSAEEEVAEPKVAEKPKIDHQYVKMEKVTLPIISGNKVLGNLMVDFSLEVDGTDNKLTVVKNLPEIRDAMLRHFSNEAIGKRENPKSIDYPRLKETLKKVSNKVLHEPMVLRVMVVQVRQF